MRLIKTDRISRRRIKTMLKELDPQMEYVRVRRNGLVVRKRRWWSLRREITTTTDTFIATLPNLITQDRNELARINTIVSAMLYSLQYTDIYDIVEFLWNKYMYVHIYPKLDFEIVKRRYFHMDSFINLNSLFEFIEHQRVYLAWAIMNAKLNIETED